MLLPYFIENSEFFQLNSYVEMLVSWQNVFREESSTKSDMIEIQEHTFCEFNKNFGFLSLKMKEIGLGKQCGKVIFFNKLGVMDGNFEQFLFITYKILDFRWSHSSTNISYADIHFEFHQFIIDKQIYKEHWIN